MIIILLIVSQLPKVVRLLGFCANELLESHLSDLTKVSFESPVGRIKLLFFSDFPLAWNTHKNFKVSKSTHKFDFKKQSWLDNLAHSLQHSQAESSIEKSDQVILHEGESRILHRLRRSTRVFSLSVEILQPSPFWNRRNMIWY